MAKFSTNREVSSYLIREHQNTLLVSLRDKDISIRRRALDLLFLMCDEHTSIDIVNEMLAYLQENDYSLKEEMVLKIAILAEKYAENLNWYIDVILKLIEFAGDYVSEDIWFRFTQIVTGFGDAEPNIELQRYSAFKLFGELQSNHVHETMVMLSAFVLAEYGYLIQEMQGKSLDKQFSALQTHFNNVGNKARCMILNSFMKFVKAMPSLKARACEVFETYADYWDEELQQRAVEYLALCTQMDSNPQVNQLI